MRSPLSLVAALAVAMLFSQSGITNAQQSSAPDPYRPSLGDLMTMIVQPRHIKLGLAGAAGNWTYAAYALHELEEFFEHSAKVRPKYHTYSIPEMLESVTREPMKAVEEAIKAGNPARFAVAYAQLTAACNTCHQSTERGFIVIQTPTASPFPDQDFRPRN
jgi:hypothetical protein